MRGESVPVSSELHERDPKRKSARTDPPTLTLIQGLERLRECIEERLGRLEEVARERTISPVTENAELERQLRRRIQEYEQAQHGLRAQIERHDQEWRAAVEQLEGDRTLLAEAWERLEREQIELSASNQQPYIQTSASNRLQPNERSPAAPVRQRPESADPANDRVADSILKQFQALRNDVRRNSRHGGPR